MIYDLKITEKQAEVIKKALDLFSRIGIGQFEEVLKHPAWNEEILKGKIKHSSMAIARMKIDEAKQLITGYNSNASMSIIVADEDSRISYDIFQIIEHTLWQNSNNKDHTANTTNAQEPMKLANHPLPEMNKCN